MEQVHNYFSLSLSVLILIAFIHACPTCPESLKLGQETEASKTFRAETQRRGDATQRSS